MAAFAICRESVIEILAPHCRDIPDGLPNTDSAFSFRYNSKFTVGGRHGRTGVTSLAGDNAREWDCRSLLADWDNRTGGSAIPGKSNWGSETFAFLREIS
jgi:hypothetical protein